MTTCKYCSEAIIWKKNKDRWVPFEIDQKTKHLCQKFKNKDTTKNYPKNYNTPKWNKWKNNYYYELKQQSEHVRNIVNSSR